MKITKKKNKGFEPITIELESVKELLVLAGSLRSVKKLTDLVKDMQENEEEYGRFAQEINEIANGDVFCDMSFDLDQEVQKLK